MLVAKDLVFRYGLGQFRMDKVSLEIEKGYVYALVGENGAGKTTLLKLLYGALTPQSGEVLWKGKRVDRRRLAAYHGEAAFVGLPWCNAESSVADNVDFLKPLYPTFDEEYWEQLLKRADLFYTVKDVPYGKLSAGEARKIGIVFCLARHPELLILDEPLANLDPVFKTEIPEILRDAVAKDGMTILMSTNLVDEIRDFTDYYGVIRDGALVKWGENTL
ncbi:MAG: ABC transporter ATP-binding protein [Lachnospiraceae bacterium]|nr:ABC transporter ATP-binding protein [Lachnospiraceae bacterium]